MEDVCDYVSDGCDDHEQSDGVNYPQFIHTFEFTEVGNDTNCNEGQHEHHLSYATLCDAGLRLGRPHGVR